MLISFFLLENITPHNMLVLWIIVFVAHYPIDKFSLAKYWLSFIGRKPIEKSDTIKEHTLLWFPLYIIVDNTFHLL